METGGTETTVNMCQAPATPIRRACIVDRAERHRDAAAFRDSATGLIADLHHMASLRYFEMVSSLCLSSMAFSLQPFLALGWQSDQVCAQIASRYESALAALQSGKDGNPIEV